MRWTHCTLANVEVVEHEERRQVSQLSRTYGAANDRACSLEVPVTNLVEYDDGKGETMTYF
jgi:hypothetical protein